MKVKTMIAVIGAVLALAASASFATSAVAGGTSVKLGQTAAGRLLETNSGLTCTCSRGTAGTATRA